LKVASGFGGVNAANHPLRARCPCLNYPRHRTPLQRRKQSRRRHPLPANLALAATETLSDPLASLCLNLATTLTRELPTPERQAMASSSPPISACFQTDLEFDLSRRDAAGRYASPAAFRGTLPA